MMQTNGMTSHDRGVRRRQIRAHVIGSQSGGNSLRGFRYSVPQTPIEIGPVAIHQRVASATRGSWFSALLFPRLLMTRLVLMALLTISNPIIVDGILAQEAETRSTTLHGEIDSAISKTYVGPQRTLASDAEFLRRVYLDLIGTIPSSSEAREFLDDRAEGKRLQLIDRLLEDPRFNQHMAKTLDIMWMERRPDKQIKQDAWIQFLKGELAERRPLNVIARKVLAADGSSEAERAAVKFYLDREAEPNVIARDIGRMFFGRDLQCAQCHDHPHIESYYQADYYGLFAFINRGYVFTSKDKVDFYAEKGEGETEYSSVFTGESGHAIPRLPRGEPIQEPTLDEDERYRVKPDKEVRGIPKFSRRERLAELTTRGDNKAFNENLANRLWAHMMGRGLVHPVDLMHDGNPATHPELLVHLGEALPSMNYDLRSFLRELARSNTYQRAYDLPAGIVEHHSKTLDAKERIEQTRKSLFDRLAGASQQKEAVLAELAQVTQTLTPLKEADASDQAQLAQLREQLAAQHQRQQQLTLQLKLNRDLQIALAKVDGAIDSSIPKLGVNGLAEDRDLLASTRNLFDRKRTQADQVIVTATEEKEQIEKMQPTLQSEIESIQQRIAQRSTELAMMAQADQEIRDRYTVVLAEETYLQQQLKRCDDQRSSLELLMSAAERTEVELNALASLKEATERYAAARQTQAAFLERRRELEAEQTQRQQQLADVQTESGDDSAALAQVRTQCESLQAAVVATKHSLQIMPDDGELQEIVNKLEQRQQQSQAECLRLAAVAEQRAQQCDKLSTQLETIASQLESLDAERVQQEIAVDEAGEAVKAAEAMCDEQNEAIAIREAALTERWEQRFILATLRPLTPEQLAWSTMTATGVVANTRTAAKAELEKQIADKQAETAPAEPESQTDSNAEPLQTSVTPRDVDQLVQEKLAGQVNAYVSLFANAGGQPQDVFFATVEQTLYFKNGGALRGWIASGGESVRARALTMTDPSEIAEELYLSTLTRRPSSEEIKSVSDYLAKQGDDTNAAIQELLWGLLTSTEFRFNH